MQVSRQITLVAEVCLETAYRQALERLIEKYGEPREEQGAPARFAILALGKLGGREIDYHSDLDILFVYSAPGTTIRPDGGPGLANSEFFARLAQRIMGALGSRTREGIAFRTDASLRPSGRAGPLVTHRMAFDAYHRKGSQTWERQALVKLRPVAADPELGQAVLGSVRQILYGAAPTEDPRPEIGRIRARVEAEVGKEDGNRIDLKAGRGGLVDVEFAVQALQLLHGWRSEDVRTPNTLEALEGLKALGVLSEDQGSSLAEGYGVLRGVVGRLRILLERATDALPADPARLGELARGLGHGGTDAEAGMALVGAVRNHRERIRAVFDGIFREG
jgi:glutamate-ammonia-ligase adenylyltransferase